VKEGAAGKGRVVVKVVVGWEMVAGVKVLVVVVKEAAMVRVGRGRAGMGVGKGAGCYGH
jgi:hypothetical protein